MKNTCLIGPPERSGVPAGGLWGRFAGGSWASACFVSLRRLFAFGRAPTPVLPSVIRGRNCVVLAVWSSVDELNGLGPFGFGPVPRPFIDSQKSWGLLPP